MSFYFLKDVRESGLGCREVERERGVRELLLKGHSRKQSERSRVRGREVSRDSWREFQMRSVRRWESSPPGTSSWSGQVEGGIWFF